MELSVLSKVIFPLFNRDVTDRNTGRV